MVDLGEKKLFNQVTQTSEPKTLTTSLADFNTSKEQWHIHKNRLQTCVCINKRKPLIYHTFNIITFLFQRDVPKRPPLVDAKGALSLKQIIMFNSSRGATLCQ